MSGTEGSLVTPRLRLVPIGPSNAADLWLVHNDDAVVPWYDGWRPSRREVDDDTGRIAESWRLHDVHKWIAYDRETDEVVGRGGLFADAHRRRLGAALRVPARRALGA